MSLGSRLFWKIAPVTTGILLVFFLGALFGPRLFIDLAADRALDFAGDYTIVNDLVAVDAQGRGVSARLFTQVSEGNGLVLVNINDVLADISTQQSARAAVKAASSLARVDPRAIDVVFTIDTDAELVSGRSAGSSMAIAVASALLNATMKKGIVMTGDISEDGIIGMVQAIPQKAKAAKALNATLFLVPIGGGSSVVTFMREKECGRLSGLKYCEVSYVPERGDLGARVGIHVVEVETLADASAYYFGNGDS